MFPARMIGRGARCHRFVMLAALIGFLGGCGTTQFARSPIEKSDPTIAHTLSGCWRGTEVDYDFRSEKPSGTVILKPLPDGRSLVHYDIDSASPRIACTGVISWMEVDGKYVGYFDGMIFGYSNDARQQVIAFNQIIQVTPDRDGDRFLLDLPEPIYQDLWKLEAELDRYDVYYRRNEQGIVIDDSPGRCAHGFARPCSITREIRAEI